MSQGKPSPAIAEAFPDVDQFLLYKWERIFSRFFDTNASGEIDWGDCYLVCRKVREIYGADSKQVGMAKTKLKGLWEEMLKQAGDAHKDHKIHSKEWIKVLKGHTPKDQAHWFLDYCTFIFKLFDVSEDNLLDMAEYADGMLAYGHPESEAHEAFHLFAVTKQGKPLKEIDFATFRHHWDDYFYSTDRKSPGNHLFGKITTNV